MGIKVTHGAKASVEAGFAVGKAQATQRQVEIGQAAKLRLEEQKRAQKHDEEMREFQASLQLQRDQSRLQLQLAAEQRAQQWDIEKMLLRSKSDFAQEETERIRKQQVHQTNTTRIKQDDTLTDTQKEKAEFLSWAENVGELPVFSANQVLHPDQDVPKAPSLTQQVRDVGALRELEATGIEEIRELLPNSTDKEIAELFPFFKAEDEEQDVVAQAEQAGGTVVVNKQTGERLVSFDGGETWEPLGSAQNNLEGEAPQKKGSIIQTIKDLLLSKPLEGKFPGISPKSRKGIMDFSSLRRQ